ncbi:oligoendopeptidase F [Melissococcus plutonius]|uniref:Oligopeptidase F n=1 Tax=Melissococcus plutonius (strain ATCC 35311 / DSM 29964 / CIP 104052 / LMG 20360 / NCIMB 702443) TaxID=940190 RepID=F3Y9M2_MELPT|nr:oligoendopeptidase F [Melissococcus plutonius]AIM24743.1 oligoendopeptidase F [Melissococcus plutonius S1]KMT24854.1 oligoendopeptidase F [Melissococcus plutonius]KMT26491.1 oligoendopeptidase F [Melissococcus plutonius]KMT27741.1 oligoendopeptidase F [Melissococcus plutonius]KMT29513.1 oligoendopeptidase F [Melissococcus plutonius]
MEKIKQLPNRSEIPKEMTWDLTKIFMDDSEFDLACRQLIEKLKEAETIKNTLKNNATTFLNGIHYLLDIYRKIETIYVYAHLKNDQDTANTTYQELDAKAGNLYAQVSEAVSWFEPEVLSMPDTQIWQYFKEEPQLEEYRHFIEDILDNRTHVLAADKEALLAGASEIFGAPSNIFSILNNADLVFPVIKNEEGKSIQLSHGIYSQLMESVDRNVRKAAYEGFYSVYRQFRNTFASTLGTHVKTFNYKAKVRNYSSAREAALKSNHIPESVYDTLVKVVDKNLPLLHRYVQLRKKLLKVDKLHMYDMYTPIFCEAPIKFSYEEAKNEALAALQPLGSEYLDIVKEAFSHRWIDVMENKGKRSGAYSSGSYDTFPYILLNWHDSLDQLYTLVHEMGHSAHSYFTRKNQPYVYGDYPIFLAEIASTTNENILTEYLLKTETKPQVRAYILNHYLDGFKGTIFRQTQFAEFEQFIHVADANGTPLTSEYLSENYKKLNRKYYGDAVEPDNEIALEWTRIPHFYYNYYVYQYATGFSAASTLANKIMTQEPHALENYLNYLKSGSSDYPIEIMKKAGVDMTRPDYIENAMLIFEKRLTELEEITDELIK